MRVFINNLGKFYKAEVAENADDMEKSVVVQEAIDVLPGSSLAAIEQNAWDILIHQATVAKLDEQQQAAVQAQPEVSCAATK